MAKIVLSRDDQELANKSVFFRARIKILEANLRIAEEKGLVFVSTFNPIVFRGQLGSDVCPKEGYDFCWECGHIAKIEEFRMQNRCPHPNCPQPKMWNH